ncbi:MAG: hypothetical protein ACRDY3_11510 [Acidimicrobiales bacterium]
MRQRLDGLVAKVRDPLERRVTLAVTIPQASITAPSVDEIAAIRRHAE